MGLGVTILTKPEMLRPKCKNSLEHIIMEGKFAIGKFVFNFETTTYFFFGKYFPRIFLYVRGFGGEFSKYCSYIHYGFSEDPS